MESGIEDTIIGGKKPKLYRINKDYAYGSKNMQEIALLHFKNTDVDCLEKM